MVVVDSSARSRRRSDGGVIVLTTNGVGFIPGGHDDQLHAADLGGQLAGIFGTVGGSMLSDMRRTSHPITDLTRTNVPIALLVTIDPNAIWLPLGRVDAVPWGPDFGELAREGERLLSAATERAAHEIVASWAAAHEIAFTLLE